MSLAGDDQLQLAFEQERLVRGHGGLDDSGGEPSLAAPIAVAREGYDINGPDWDESPDDPVTDPNFHLWNLYSQSQQEALENPRLQPLINHHKANFGNFTDIEYAREMQFLYNRHIRDFLADPTNPSKRRRGPCWPKRNIIKYHTMVRPSIAAIIESRLRMMHSVLEVYENNGVKLKQPETGEESIDENKWKMCLNTYKEMRTWFPLLDKYVPEKKIVGII